MNMDTKSPITEWDEVFNKMSHEELKKYMATPETSNFELLKLASKVEKKNSKEDMPDLMKVFLKALKKRRLKYEVGGDTVSFTYRRKLFIANLDFEDEFIIINFLHKIFIDKDDDAKLSMLGKAINATNKVCSVNTYYEGECDNNVDFIYVKSHFCINFVVHNPNFESELRIALEDFYNAQYILKGLMKRRRTRK